MIDSAQTDEAIVVDTSTPASSPLKSILVKSDSPESNAKKPRLKTNRVSFELTQENDISMVDSSVPKPANSTSPLSLSLSGDKALTKRFAVKKYSDRLNVDYTNSNTISETGDIELLVALAKSTDDVITIRYIVQTFMRLASNDNNKDTLRQAGIIEPLVSLLSSTSDSVTKQYLAQTLVLMAGNITNQITIRNAGGIALLNLFLDSTDDKDVQQNAQATLKLINPETSSVMIAPHATMFQKAPSLPPDFSNQLDSIFRG